MLFYQQEEFYNRTGEHMQRAYMVLFICLLGVVIMACSPQKDAQSGSQEKPRRLLKVGTSTDYPPFSLQQQGAVVGLEIDLMRALAQEMACDVEFVDIDFSGLMPALKSHRIDAVIASLAISPERQKSVDFTDPYYKVRSAVLFRTQHGGDWIEKNQWEGKSVGVQLGSSLEQEAHELAVVHKGMRIQTINKTLAMVQELKLDRLDAVLLDEQQAKVFAQCNEELGYHPLPTQEGKSWAIAVNPKDPLKEEFNAALETIKAKGQLGKIQQRWLGIPDAEAQAAGTQEAP